MFNRKCCCADAENTKRTLRNNPNLDNWTIRNSSSQITELLKPDIYEEYSSDGDGYYSPKNEVTKTQTKIKWAAPYNKLPTSKYHQKCFNKNLKKFPKPKLRKQVPSQVCRHWSPYEKKPKFINECYCCSAPKKPLLPQKPDLTNDKTQAESQFDSETSYSLETLQTAKELLHYSPESKFLKKLRKEAQEAYDCKCQECRMNKENSKLKFTDRRKYLEEAYQDFDDQQRYTMDGLCRNLHQCNKNTPRTSTNSPSPRCQPKCLSPKPNHHNYPCPRPGNPRYPSTREANKAPVFPTGPLYPHAPKRTHPKSPQAKLDIHSYPLQTPLNLKYRENMNSPCDCEHCESSRRNSPKLNRPKSSDANSQTDFQDYQPLMSRETPSNGSKVCKCASCQINSPNRRVNSEKPSYNNNMYQQDLPKDKQNTGSTQDCDKINSVRNIRDANYFECHSTSHLNPSGTQSHQCVHKFELDERLLPKALNSDPFGVSRCTICNKPMENGHITQNLTSNNVRDQQSSSQLSNADKGVQRPNSGTTLKYSYIAPRKIHIGNKNDIIELKVPPSLIQDSKIVKFKKPMVPENTWALRYQRGVV